MRKITLLGLAALAAAAFASVAPAAAPGHRHDMSTMSANAASQQLASQLALGRLATAKYATNLALAKRNGYGVITQMIPDMGWHFMNPKITTFDITQAADSRVRHARLDRGSSSPSNGSSRRSRRRRRCRARRTARSGRPATTRTARSRSRRARRSCATTSPQRVPRSTSGIPTSSRSTCGSGIRTPTACSRE